MSKGFCQMVSMCVYACEDCASEFTSLTSGMGAGGTWILERAIRITHIGLGANRPTSVWS